VNEEPIQSHEQIAANSLSSAATKFLAEIGVDFGTALIVAALLSGPSPCSCGCHVKMLGVTPVLKNPRNHRIEAAFLYR
jgi:hypothetical protein